MKLLVDMNLSPEWLDVLDRAGWESRHWTSVGPPDASDAELLHWAQEHGYTVLTQDLDFTQLLFHLRSRGPSVVLLRVADELSQFQQERVCVAIKSSTQALETGAVLVIDEHRARVRRLPIHPGENPSGDLS